MMIHSSLKKRYYPLYIYFSGFDNNLAVVKTTLNIIYWCVRAATHFYWISIIAMMINVVACYIYTKHNQNKQYKDSLHMTLDFFLVALFMLIYDSAKYIIKAKKFQP